YQYRRLGKFGPTTVFENTSRLPRAFVVHSVHTVKDEKSAEGTFAAHSTRLPDGALHVVSFDPRREAVVEGGPELRPSTCSGSNDATIVRYEPEQVVVDSNASCPGLLILTDTVYPGWSATVNGRSAPILPTDIAFRGVVVPA